MTQKIRILLVFCALAMVWFGTLDYRKLIRTDEGRYADIALEMAATGDWLTPRLNGIKYFEKPPLQYWMTAIAFKTLGVHEWTARLWPAITSFLGILLAWFCGTRLFGARAGVYAAAVLSTCLLYLFIGQANTLDMGFTFFMELTLCSFLLAQHDKTNARRWTLLAWVGLALSVLSKGIVSLVLIGATLAIYTLVSSDRSFWKRMEFKYGIPLFLLVAAPWFIAVSYVNPEFAWFFFVHEHFQRFLTKVHHRYGPPWYFVPIFLLGAMPWTTLMLQTLWQGWAVRAEATFQAVRFLLVWSAVVFVFFSISDSKLPSYILPIFPALAMVLGDALSRVERRVLLWHVAFVGLVACLALLLIPALAAHRHFEASREWVNAYIQWILCASATWLAGAALAFWCAWKKRNTQAILALATFSLIAGMTVLLGHENLSRQTSAYYIAAQIKPQLPPGVPFYSVSMYDHTLPFYLQRTLTLVEHPDEMAFGLEHEPWRWLPTIEAFKQHWAADPDAFAVMAPDDYDKLRGEGLPMTLVARDTRLVVVRKAPGQ
jgi:4-amino-4-deoxy-L-arabinose transferase-like glycosyltransferase